MYFSSSISFINCSLHRFSNSISIHYNQTPIEQLILEANNLAKKGVKELILIAQDLTYYGLDIYKKRRLADLLIQLSKVNGIDWIHLDIAGPGRSRSSSPVYPEGGTGFGVLGWRKTNLRQLLYWGILKVVIYNFTRVTRICVWKLGKLVYIFDDNNISIDGNVEKVSVTDQSAKFKSLGWHVQEIDGHNETQIINAVKAAQDNTSKPSLIIAKSTIGKYSEYLICVMLTN